MNHEAKRNTGKEAVMAEEAKGYKGLFTEVSVWSGQALETQLSAVNYNHSD